MPTPIRELLSQTSYDADGATTVWNFSFAGGYIDRAHVMVQTLDKATGTITQFPITNANFIGDFQLELTPAFPLGLELTIYRDTPKDVPLVNFADRAALTEAALDLNAKQAIFVAAESSDLLITSIEAVAEISLLAESARNFSESAEASAQDAQGSAMTASLAADAAAASALAASQSATQALVSENAAEAAAATVGGLIGTVALALLPFDTLAEATVAAVTLPDGQPVDALDEQKRYRVEAGALVFVENLDQLRIDLADPAKGAGIVRFLHSGLGAVARWVRDKLMERPSVKDFGAKGDGVTNDTAAIMAAIEACNDLFVPEGSYLIDGLSIDKNNFSMKGAGYARSKLVMTEAANAALLVADSANVSSLSLTGLLIQGNATNLGGIKLGKNGLYYAGKLKFRDLLIDGFSNPEDQKGYAIQFCQNQNTDLVNIWSQNNRIGLHRANGGYSTSTRISGKDTYLGHGDHGALFEGQCDDFYIEDAVVEGNRGAGIVATPIAATLTGDGRGTRLILGKVYFEENNTANLSEAAGVVIKGNAFGYAQHTLDLTTSQFAANPSNPGTKDVYLDRAFAYIARSNLIPGKVETTPTVTARFENMTFPNGANYADQYRALLGNISVSDFTPASLATDLNQFNFHNAITFPATGRPVSDPNTLDDYREGVWTPTTSGLIGTVTSITGEYTKVGRLVMFKIVIQGTGVSSLGTAELSLPTTLASITSCTVMGVVPNQNLGFGYVSSGVVTLPAFTEIASALIIITGSYTTNA